MHQETVNSPDLSMLMLKLSDQPMSVKTRALKIYCLSQLRYISRKEIMTFLAMANSTSTIDYALLQDGIDALLKSSRLIHNRLREKLNAINQELFAETLPDENDDQLLGKLSVQLFDVKQKILTVAQASNENMNSLPQALEVIERQAANRQKAMYEAVQIIIDRLIDSFDPESFEKFIDKKVMRVGPLKKAAMLDVAKDKYEQVAAYQKEGKMLRDFKVHYKSQLKKLNQLSENPVK